jgi:AcrR family transcriptional regulator
MHRPEVAVDPARDSPRDAVLVTAAPTIVFERATLPPMPNPPGPLPTRRRPGRAPAATREQALDSAKRRYLAGERVDVQAIARELGLGRVTMYRWFQTRERLLGEAVGEISEERLLQLRRQTRLRGARGLLRVFDRFNQDVVATAGLGALLERDKERALRLLTSSAGEVQPRIVATTQKLIEEEVQAGRFEPAVSPDFLAYGLVRLGEAFLYNDTAIGVRGDTRHLREMQAVLLGLRGTAAAPAAAKGTSRRAGSRTKPAKPRIKPGAKPKPSRAKARRAAKA